MGKTIELVSLDLKIAKNSEWYTWLNDQIITKYTKQGYFPLSKSEHIKYYKENILSKKRLQLGVVDIKSQELIGMISLYGINHIDGNCFISALFNKNSKHISSIEYFREAQILLINHAFDKLNLRRIEAASNDKKMAKMNERLFGFKCEGILKERDYIDGKFIDRYILSLLKNTWKN